MCPDLNDLKAVAEVVFHGVSTLAVLGAAIKYLRSRDQQSGETLLRLEQYFEKFHKPWTFPNPESSHVGITRAIDPETHLLPMTALSAALEKSGETRDALEESWMARLDELLRFLLMVAAMERSHLLRRRALWDAYSYWFNAIWVSRPLSEYVRNYYPLLYGFVNDRINREIFPRARVVARTPSTPTTAIS